MTFPTLATVNATEDVSELLVYVNTITDGWAMPSVLLGFFLVVFLGGIFMQIRFKGNTRIDFAFASASFTTFGLAVLMSLRDGLLNPFYLLLCLGMSILGAVVLYLSKE